MMIEVGDIIEVGDMIEVVDNGKIYSAYKTFITTICPTYLPMFKDGKTPNNGENCVIIAKGEHLTYGSNYILYVIQSLYDSIVYVIGETGIKLKDEIVEEEREFKSEDIIEVVDNELSYINHMSTIDMYRPEYSKFYIAGTIPKEGELFKILNRVDENDYIIKELFGSQVYIINKQGFKLYKE